MSDEEYWRSLGMTEQTLGAFPIISLVAVAELVIQARRAGREQVADIMQRRTWFPRFIGSIEGKQRWVVYCWNGLCDLRDTTAVWMYANTKERAAHLVFEDPIQALIETEKWYVENVEKPHAAAIRGGGG